MYAEATLTLTVTNATPLAVDDAGGNSGLLPTGEDVVIEQLETPIDAGQRFRQQPPADTTITQPPGTHSYGGIRRATGATAGCRYQEMSVTGPDNFVTHLQMGTPGQQ
jgi:hypothetical protein